MNQTYTFAYNYYNELSGIKILLSMNRIFKEILKMSHRLTSGFVLSLCNSYSNIL